MRALFSRLCGLSRADGRLSRRRCYCHSLRSSILELGGPNFPQSDGSVRVITTFELKPFCRARQYGAVNASPIP